MLLASLGATTGGDLDLDIINAPSSPRETSKTARGKANANIINIAHLCRVQRREGRGGCSHTPGDTHSSATSPSPLLGGGGCGARSGTSGWRFPGGSPVKLTGTGPEKVPSIIATVPVTVPGGGGSKKREERFPGRGGCVGGRQRSRSGGHTKPRPQGSRPRPSQAGPESPGGEGECARAEPAPPPEPRPPRRDSRPPSGPPRPPVCAPAQRAPLGGRNRGEGVRRATPAASLGPKSPPASPAEAAVAAGVEGVAAPRGPGRRGGICPPQAVLVTPGPLPSSAQVSVPFAGRGRRAAAGSRFAAALADGWMPRTLES